MIIHTLKQQFNDAEFNIVVRALRQDTIIWSALQDTEFLNRIRTAQLTGLKPWMPANIALIWLFPHSGPKMLSALPNNLDQETKFRAANTLEALLSPAGSPDTENDLTTAALAAIAIRERWLMLDTVETAFLDQVSSNPLLWQTILSILYGLLPHAGKLLEALLQSPDENHHLLSLQLVTSQPQEMKNQTAALLPALLNIPSLQRLSILQSFESHDPALTRHLAHDLLETLPEAEPDQGKPMQTLITFMERTELLKMQGSYQAVLPALDQIREMTTSLQADLTAQLAQAAARGNDQKTALEAISKVSALEEEIITGNQNITLAQIHTGTLEDTAEIVLRKSGETKNNHAALLASARMAIQNQEPEQAQRLAQQAFTETKKGLLKGSIHLAPEFIHTLIELLLAVNLVEEAVQIGALAQKITPNNATLISLYARALKQFGKLSEALEYTYIARALAGDLPAIHRELIDILMQNRDWIEARKEAEKLITSSEIFVAGDFVLLAEAYLQTGQASDAIAACEKGLAVDPENWELLHMLARVYQSTHDIRSAERSLSKAIIYNPERIDSWLELADLHSKYNEPEKALEKLISADNVNPNNARINLQIGLAYQTQGEPLKALAAFNQAARFIQPDTDIKTRKEIGLQLGKALYQGGYIEEAVTAFGKAYQQSPTDVELATWYAQALVNTGDFSTAFPVLTLVVQSQEPSIETRLDYADLILKLEKSPEEALTHINTVLELDPQHERGRILLAKATAASDDHCAALELYQEAMQTELSRQPEYFTALTIGVAESAFKTEQPHVAITFLREGLNQIPDNLPLKKTLCQAYIHANLKPEALSILAEIQELAAPTLQNYLWIADQAVALDALALATDNLNLASQIAPHNTEIIVRLGYIQLENGQEAQAKETFGQLFEVENVDITDLKMAAHALIGMNDPHTSIPFIEQALELCDYQSKDLLAELTRLQIESEQYLAALETLNKHLQIEGKNASLWITKSRILEQLGRPKAAASSIEEALRLAPGSAELHLQAAKLLRAEHDLPSCLTHVTKASQLAPQSPDAALQAAEIFRACLKFGEAQRVLRQVTTQPAAFEWQIMMAELIIGEDSLENHYLADEALNLALKIKPNDLRALAVQTRIQSGLGNSDEAAACFEHAWSSINTIENNRLDPFDRTNLLLTLGEAAAALNKWPEALNIIKKLPQEGLKEPRAHLYIARTLTRQAEHQLACSAVKARSNGPGKAAFSEESRAQFEQAIENLYQLTPESDAAVQILRWEQRGSYAIKNQAPYPSPTLVTKEDLAALLAASRRVDQPLDLNSIPDEWLNDKAVKFQLSLTYSLSDLGIALEIAEDLAANYTKNPIYQAHFAHLCHRANRNAPALDFIRKALELWQDEPDWQLLAGDLSLQIREYERAIDHMEQASNLDPENPVTLFKLGLAYMKGGLPGNAIRVLERAVNQEPLNADYWARLAQAHHAAGEYGAATASIEKAVKLAPKLPKFLLMAADIAADHGSLLKRDKFIRQAIELNPRETEDIIHLTRLLIRKNDREKALNVLDEVISHAVDATPLQLQKAAIIRETAGINEEIKLLVNLAKQDPKNPLILARLSAAYLQTENLVDAIKAGQYAIKNAGTQLSPKQVTRLHYQVGALFHRTGQLDQAISHLSKAINRMPQFLEAYLEIAKTLKSQRSYNKALQYLENAIRIAPEDPRPYLEAGLMHKEGKNYQQAETMLKQAAALAPEDTNIKRHLASVIAMAIIHQRD
ncbi:MAG: tetratricopeptide repeat protein [Anaerolineales bacterium]|nr:tetratricopeptide repeat protein [Anaerolineales bacterium]